MLQSMGSQKVGHDWVTETNWTELLHCRQILYCWRQQESPEIKYIDLWNKKIHKKSWGTWENITSKNAYKTPLGKSPPNPLKFHDEEFVISVAILTETHTREFCKKKKIHFSKPQQTGRTIPKKHTHTCFTWFYAVLFKSRVNHSAAWSTILSFPMAKKQNQWARIPCETKA